MNSSDFPLVQDGVEIPGLVKKPLEEWLDEVRYSEDSKYIPSDFALKFVTFIKLVTDGEGEENKTPVLHLRMLDKIANGDNRIANMLFRGAAKTTLLCEYMVLYLAVYGKLDGFGEIDLCIYVSDSMDNGVKNFRKNVEYRWANSNFLQMMIPKAVFTDARFAFTNADGMEFIVKNYGAKTGVRGTKEKGKRPQLALLDDLVSDDDARSDAEIRNIEATVYSAIDYALHPTHSLIIWSGTPFNAKDPLYKAVESGAWTVNVFPVCEKFPCTKEEFRGAWPERFTYEMMVDKYRKAILNGKLSSFYQELMLRITSADQMVVLPEDIGWYSKSILLKKPGDFNFYMTTDFATSEKQHADFNVICVWAINSSGRIFLVDGICKKQLMDRTINDLFILAQRYKPMSVGIETSGQQAGFIPWIQEQMMQRNIWFSLAEEGGSVGLSQKTGKLQRFNIFLPTIKSKMFFLPYELKESELVKEMVTELTLVTDQGFRSKNDDCLDNISMLPRLRMLQPSGSESSLGSDSMYADPWESEHVEESAIIQRYLV